MFVIRGGGQRGGPYLSLMRVYSELCAQGSLLTMFSRQYRLTPIKLGQPHTRQVPSLRSSLQPLGCPSQMASVLSSVAVHASDLSDLLVQMKLLNLYIKRAQTGSGGTDPTTDLSGQS